VLRGVTMLANLATATVSVVLALLAVVLLACCGA